MAKNQRNYDKDFKVEAVKLSMEIGSNRAAKELGVPSNTLSGWRRAARLEDLNVEGFHTPEVQWLYQRKLQPLENKFKEQGKEIRRLKKENECYL